MGFCAIWYFGISEKSATQIQSGGQCGTSMGKNWIQWIPQDNGLWRPFNVQQVESWHAECKALVVYNWGSGSFREHLF